MQLLKSLLLFLLISSAFLMFTGCSGGEADYSLNDVTAIEIDSNTNTKPMVFPILNSPITTVKVLSPVQNDTYFYSISGADSSFFGIDQNGTLFFTTLPFYNNIEDQDHNNIFEVIIKVASHNNSASIHISITIADDINHVLPTIISSHIDIFENDNTGIQVQAASGTTSTLNYTLEPGYDETLFTIDINSGLLFFNTAPSFESPQDSDADNSYYLIVRVTDQTTYANTVTKPITVNVLDLSTPSALKFEHLVATDGEGTDHYRIEVDPTHLYTWWKKDYIRTYSVQLNATALNNPYPLTYTLISGASIFSLSTDGLLSIVLPKYYGDNPDLPVVIDVCNAGECQEMTLHVQTD